MSLWCTNRRVPLWIILGFLGLAVFVFAWGLGYKLSLYDPPQSSTHQLPQAKLLSRNEQDSFADTSLTSQENDSVKKNSIVFAIEFFYFVLTFAFLNHPLSGERMREAEQPWRLRKRAGLNFFFVLPPPSLA